MYLEIVERLKEIIDQNNLGPGDKLPSERDLAGKLNAGRSSVREALRSLELLGLIETRRGEGTFIADVNNHRLVEILSSFILQSERAKNDVTETKELVEIMAIYSLIRKKKPIETDQLLQQLEEDDEAFFERLLMMTDNFLLLRLWRIVSNYEKSLKLKQKKADVEVYENLLKAIDEGDWNRALELYMQNIRS